MLSQVLAGAELAPCGNCGSGQVRCRLRPGRADRGTAQIVCAHCGARSELFTGPDATRRAADAWARRPHAPAVASPAPVLKPRAQNKERAVERDPLELIARMLVGGSYRMPTEGRSTGQPLTSSDVAAAVGLMRDPIAKRAVLAVAMRQQGPALTGLARAAVKRVMRQTLQQRNEGRASGLRMEDPADRWRIRLVMQDAVNDFVWPERKRPAQEAAKAAKLRKCEYLRAYGVATATLRQALEDGRREFSGRVFGR